MVHNPPPVNAIDNIAQRQKLRLRFLAEPFKGFGQVLLFYSPTTDCVVLEAFQTLMLNLSDGQQARVAVHEEPYIKPYGQLQVYAVCNLNRKENVKRNGIVRINTSSNSAFEWICDAETWRDFGGLVSGLIRFNGGHQYLESHPLSDVQVIVSTGEYYDEDFEKAT
jgi:hypothetical protein